MEIGRSRLPLGWEGVRISLLKCQTRFLLELGEYTQPSCKYNFITQTSFMYCGITSCRYIDLTQSTSTSFLCDDHKQTMVYKIKYGIRSKGPTHRKNSNKLILTLWSSLLYVYHRQNQLFTYRMVACIAILEVKGTKINRQTGVVFIEISIKIVWLEIFSERIGR